MESTSPKKKKKKYPQSAFSMVMTMDVRERLASCAESQDRTAAAVARIAIIKYLEEQGF